MARSLLLYPRVNMSMPKTRLIPRTRLVERRHAEESINYLKSIGVRRFQVTAARDGWDCPSCQALDGGTFNVDEPPAIPPRDCRCKPYGCRLVVTAWREKTP